MLYYNHPFSERCESVSFIHKKGYQTMLWRCNARLFSLLLLCVLAGADVNISEEVFLTPLMFVALQGRDDLAELLLQNGADVNFQWKGNTGRSCHFSQKNIGISHNYFTFDCSKEKFYEWSNQSTETDRDPFRLPSSGP